MGLGLLTAQAVPDVGRINALRLLMRSASQTGSGRSCTGRFTYAARKRDQIPRAHGGQLHPPSPLLGERSLRNMEPRDKRTLQCSSSYKASKVLAALSSHKAFLHMKRTTDSKAVPCTAIIPRYMQCYSRRRDARLWRRGSQLLIQTEAGSPRLLQPSGLSVLAQLLLRLSIS